MTTKQFIKRFHEEMSDVPKLRLKQVKKNQLNFYYGKKKDPFFIELNVPDQKGRLKMAVLWVIGENNQWEIYLDDPKGLSLYFLDQTLAFLSNIY